MIYVIIPHVVAASSLLVSLTKRYGVPLYFAVLLIYKLSIVRVDTSWKTILIEGDVEAAVAAFSGYWLIASVTLLAKRYGISLRISLSKTIGWALIGAGVAALLRNPVSLEVHILTALTWSVYGGVVEEIYFRGIVYTILEKAVSTALAILVQAILFAAAHPWSLEAFVASLILGLVLGVLKRSQGISSCIGLHFGLNVFTHV